MFMRDLTEEGPLQSLPSLRCTMLVAGDLACVPFGSVFVEKAVGDKNSVSMRVTLPFICAENKLHAQLLKKFHPRAPINAVYQSLMSNLEAEQVHPALAVSTAVANARIVADASLAEHIEQLGRYAGPAVSTQAEPFLSRQQQVDIQTHESIKLQLQQIHEAETQDDGKGAHEAKQLRVGLEALAGAVHKHSKFPLYSKQQLSQDPNWIFGKTDIYLDASAFSSWLTDLAVGLDAFQVAPTLNEFGTEDAEHAEAGGAEVEDESDSEEGPVDSLQSVREACEHLEASAIAPYIRKILDQNADDYIKKEPLLVKLAKRHPLFQEHIDYIQPDAGPEWVFGGPDDDTCESLAGFCDWLLAREPKHVEPMKAEAAENMEQQKKQQKKKEKKDKSEKKDKKEKKKSKKENGKKDSGSGNNSNKRGSKKESKQQATTTSPNGKKRKAGVLRFI